MKCIRCQVTGRVQGVWYRGSTQSQAQALGITGYAHNLTNGAVEVLACGESSNIQQLKDWLWQGPRLAEVADVQCESIEMDTIPTIFATD